MTFDEWWQANDYKYGYEGREVSKAAWEAQQSRIDDTEKMLDSAITQVGIYKQAIDAHNARCDEACESRRSRHVCTAEHEIEMCSNCPLHYRIEDTTNE